MEFASPLLQGKLLKRYKRFFADVVLDGQIVVAHVPNTGSMMGCNEPGSACLVSRATDPARKLQFTLEAVQADQHWVGVNTSWPNKLAIELFHTQVIPHWKIYDSYQTEIKISEASRIDLVLWSSQSTETKKWKSDDFKKHQPVHFIEIKNVTLKNGVTAQFPDAVTERGQKHIEELVSLLQRGFTSELLFVVQRSDVQMFEPAAVIDPRYAELLRDAIKKGLKVTVASFAISKKEIQFQKLLHFS